MTDEQLLIGLLWGEIPLGIEAAVTALMKREGLYDVWEEAMSES